MKVYFCDQCSYLIVVRPRLALPRESIYCVVCGHELEDKAPDGDQ